MARPITGFHRAELHPSSFFFRLASRHCRPVFRVVPRRRLAFVLLFTRQYEDDEGIRLELGIVPEPGRAASPGNEPGGAVKKRDPATAGESRPGPARAARADRSAHQKT